MILPAGEVFQKGMAGLKQAVLSMVAVLIAAGILASMVLYSIWVIRTAELRILTGEFSVVEEQCAD